MNGIFPTSRLVHVRAGRNKYVHVHETESLKLEKNGYKVYPSSKEIRYSRKENELQVINSSNIKDLFVPRTIIANSAEELMKIYANKLNFFEEKKIPLVIKSSKSSMGKRIWLVRSTAELKTIFNEIESWDYPILCQEYIENKHLDVRTLVLEGRVITQFIRYNPTSFKSNLAMGGIALSPEKALSMGLVKSRSTLEKIKSLTLQIGELLGYTHYASDFLLDLDETPWWIENNISFGFHRTEEQLNINIAKEIALWLISKINSLKK